MKKLTEYSPDWSSLGRMMNDGIRSEIFSTALRLHIFDFTDGATADEIAGRANTHPRNTGLFLNALAAMGLIRKLNGRFSHSELSKRYLDTNSEHYLGEYLLHMRMFHEQLGVDMLKLVKSGPPEQQADIGDSQIWADSARRAAAYQRNGEVQRIAKIVSQLPEFPSMRRMLDMGGGSGFYAIAIVQAHPCMEGVIFEQPSVADVALDFLQEYGASDRITVISGDYTRDDLQGPYDFIFASATLNFAKERFDSLFKKVHAALTPGGVFMTHQDGFSNERTHPLNHITEFLGPEMMGADFAIEQGEIAEAMLRSGFVSVRSFTKHSNIGEMCVDIGRKAR